MHVEFVAQPDLVNSNYRAYLPMMELGHQGHRVSFNKLGAPRFDLDRLAVADVVHVHRYIDDEALAVARSLRDAGVAVVFDNDDDLTRIPRSNPYYARFGGVRSGGVAARLAAMARTAHVVTTPSAALAGQFRAMGAVDVRVVENFLPNAFPGTGPLDHDGVRVVWLAGLEHQLDYEQLRLRDVLEGLLDAHAHLRVLSIGLGLGLRSDRYEHVPSVEFPGLARALARADVGIAPLADIPWNRARSNVKLKEYGAAGLAWLASPVGAYRALGERHGGRLVADDGWADALDRLVVRRRERRKLAKRAARWARGETIRRNVRQWLAAYEAAITAARGRRTSR